MEKVLEEQEKKLRSEMAITKAEYEEKINTMQSKQTDITKQLDSVKVRLFTAPRAKQLGEGETSMLNQDVYRLKMLN